MSRIPPVAIAGGVLLGEYLLLSFVFDARSVIERGGAWEWIARIGQIAPLGVVLLAGVLMWRLARSADRVDEAPERALVATQVRWGWLALHAAAYAVFFGVTRWLFHAAEAPVSAAWGFSLWVCAGLICLGTLLAGVTSARAVRAAVSSRAVLFGLGLGPLAWLGGQLSVELWDPLAAITFKALVVLLSLTFADVTVVPEERLLGLEDFAVLVAPVCSGFEGMGLITVLMVGYLAAFRAQYRFPHALLLVPVAIFAAWSGNVLRIYGLMIVGARLSADVAYGAFHSRAGWVLFCTIALGLAWSSGRIRWLAREQPSDATHSETEEFENPTAAYLIPLLTLAATSFVTGAFQRDLDYAYALPILVAAVALYRYRAAYAALAWRISPLAVTGGLVVGVGWVLSVPIDPDAASWVRQAFAPHGQIWFVAWVAMRALGSTIVVPICEELAFRGFLQRRLVAREFQDVPFTRTSLLAVLGAAVAFGLLHQRWIAGTLAGVVYGALQVKSGRLTDAIVAHGVSNGVIALAVLCGDDWTHWV